MVRRRTSQDIRSESRTDVLHALLVGGVSTRNGLVRSTGLSPATVATVVGELLAARVVTVSGVEAGAVGRPTTTLRINAERGRVVGVDVAETYVRTVVFDTALGPLGTAEVARDEHEDAPGYVVEGVERSFAEALARTGVPVADVLGAGVALPRWTARGTDLAALPERLGVPVVVDNPLKAIATAELWFGAGRSAESVVTVNLGTGVGAGVVLQGQVLRGFANGAGEWGHTLLVPEGRRCRCGRSGCVEAYVGAGGLQETLRAVDGAHPLAGVPLQRDFVDGLRAALDAGDPVAAATLARAAQHLGEAVADLVAVLDPEAVLLTGWTVWALGEHLLPAVEPHVRTAAARQGRADLALGLSQVRGNAVAVGVATLAMERFLRDEGLVTSAPLGL